MLRSGMPSSSGALPISENHGQTWAASDSVVTPFGGVLRETVATACISVRLRKLGDVQYTIVERFPKLDVAGSSPVSRSILNHLRTQSNGLLQSALIQCWKRTSPASLAAATIRRASKLCVSTAWAKPRG